jgi:hypothetical protein
VQVLLKVGAIQFESEIINETLALLHFLHHRLQFVKELIWFLDVLNELNEQDNIINRGGSISGLFLNELILV